MQDLFLAFKDFMLAPISESTLFQLFCQFLFGFFLVFVVLYICLFIHFKFIAVKYKIKD